MPQVVFGATADIHIFPFSQYSTYNSIGVPSRLNLFLTLADLMAEELIKRQATALLIAGDINHSPNYNRPMTIKVTTSFLEKLANSVSSGVLITDGQHDMDTKSKFSESVHSMASNYRYISQLQYVHNGVTDWPLGYKIYARGWDPDGIVLEHDADIFLGHGIVAGSSTSDHFVFRDGIRAEDLAERYALSIVGDVHNKQLYRIGRRCVLIPGTPMQQSFRDPEECGFWILNFDGEYTDAEFVRLTHPKFHKFIILPENTYLEDTDLLHYKTVGPRSKNKVTTDHRTHSLSNLQSIFNLLQDELQHLSPPNIDLAVALLRDLVGSIKFDSTKSLPEILIKSVKIEGYGNIEKFDLNVEDLPSPLLILGPNGSGKSTLIDAIYWGLTGTSAKWKLVNQVINKHTTSGCLVIVRFTSNGQEYTISRSRNHETCKTSVSIISNEKSFQRSSMSDTNSLISEIVGASTDLILSTSYLSSRNLRIFGDLTESNKYDLIAQLANISIIDDLRARAQDLWSDLNSESQRKSGEVATIEAQIRSLSDKIESAKLEIERIRSSQEAQYFDKKYSDYLKDSLKTANIVLDDQPGESFADLANRALSVVSDRLTKFPPDLQSDIDSVVNLLTEIRAKQQSLEDQVSRIEIEIDHAKSEIDSVVQRRVCPMCNRQFSDQETKEEIIRRFDLPRKISQHQEMVTILSEISGKVHNLQQQRDELFSQSAQFALISKLRIIILDLLSKFNSEKSKSEEAYVTLISELTPMVEGLRAQLDTLNIERADILLRLETMSIIYKSLLSRNGPGIRKMIESTCQDISDELDSLLSDSAINAEISISGTRPELVCYVGRDKFSYDEISEGERRIINLAILIAFNNIVSRRHGLRYGVLGLLVLDEVFQFLDASYAELAFSLLGKSVSKLVIVVSHDERIQSFFNNVIRVDKINKLARYSLLV